MLRKPDLIYPEGNKEPMKGFTQGGDKIRPLHMRLSCGSETGGVKAVWGDAGERYAGLRLACTSRLLHHNSESGPNLPFSGPLILLTLPRTQAYPTSY